LHYPSSLPNPHPHPSLFAAALPPPPSLLQAFDLETGAKLQEFFATDPLQTEYFHGDMGRGISVFGEDIYYTTSGSGKVFKTNSVTHENSGFVFDTGWKGIRSVSFDGSNFWVREDGSNELRRYAPDGTLLSTLPNFSSSFDVWGDQIFAADATGFGIFDFGGNAVRHLFDYSPATYYGGMAFDGTYISTQNSLNTINTYDLQGNLIRSTTLGGLNGPIRDDRCYVDFSFVRQYATAETVPETPALVPEPGSLSLLGFGLGMLAFSALRRRERKGFGTV
jgi:PEP-CTERM motif